MSVFILNWFYKTMKMKFDVKFGETSKRKQVNIVKRKENVKSSAGEFFFLFFFYFWQKSCPQFLQWWRRSVREKRTVQVEQLSTTSSFTQWSAAERPGWSLTDQLKTRPSPSPTRILLWSLKRRWHKSKIWGKIFHGKNRGLCRVVLEIVEY